MGVVGEGTLEPKKNIPETTMSPAYLQNTVYHDDLRKQQHWFSSNNFPLAISRLWKKNANLFSAKRTLKGSSCGRLQ